jgi:hypothetical protein
MTLQNDMSTCHLFLRRPVLPQAAARGHDQQLWHQQMKRRGLRRMAFETAATSSYRFMARSFLCNLVDFLCYLFCFLSFVCGEPVHLFKNFNKA